MTIYFFPGIGGRAVRGFGHAQGSIDFETGRATSLSLCINFFDRLCMQRSIMLIIILLEPILANIIKITPKITHYDFNINSRYKARLPTGSCTQLHSCETLTNRPVVQRTGATLEGDWVVWIDEHR